ncbi:MAG: B12-binding domain-containing radical SAM protein [Pseudomonadota bacterium]
MTRILLSSVFGPYGVDDAYGRKENVMELFHNQVTREQGMFSLRFHHPSFGLHLLAANIDADVTVLDFPSQQRFVEEIRKGYDYVGLSFIAPNVVKAQRMAELIRAHAPASKIVLGGHGTRIPDIAQRVDADHICSGEGVRWLRQLLGEDPDRPIRHPTIKSALSKRILGLPRPVEAAVLIPGVGCPNACRFCATSHFFDRAYTAYLPTGEALLEACLQVEAELGLHEFFIMDENFLKYRERAERFVELLEQHGKRYRFNIFSSAETIREVGIDFMVRMGVEFLWLGVESKHEIYEKNRGVDFHALIAELRDHGITVLASGILFLEHHDRETLQQDVDFMVSLNADLVQFMQLGPMPQTALYKKVRDEGVLLDDVPYEERHGQDRIWFKHPHFERDETKDLLRQAFERDYQINGPSLLRLFETTARGALRIPGDDDVARRAREAFARRCVEYRPVLRWMRRFAPTPRAADQARHVEEMYAEVLGPETVRDRALSMAALPFVIREWFNARTGRNMYQPPTVVTSYPQPLPAKRRLAVGNMVPATASIGS